MTRLVVGLGNPGPEYEWTRHNVGFHVVDRLAGEEGVIFESARRLPDYTGAALFTFARSKRFDALFVKPLTFMNLSGTAVTALAQNLQLAPESILVVYDDMDLDFKRLRIRAHGGPGTHNGMRSIVATLGTDRFPRLRVGIGIARTDAARHVLERFSKAEMQDAEISVAEAADAIRAWLGGEDLDGVMTRFHSRWNQGS